VVQTPAISARHADLWECVDAVLDRLEPQHALAHDLGPLAARRLRARGRPVPPALAQEEKGARLAAMVAPRILEQARLAQDGPLLLLKGPELAARYPGSTRLFTDLDLLAPDAAATRAALLAGGFDEVDDPTGQYAVLEHHLTPVRLGGLPLEIELHSKPKWPRHLPEPAMDELFATAVPTSVGVEGLETPDPAHHALLLAVHAWAHGAFRSARDLLDVALMTAESDRAEITRIADSWGIERLWHTTISAADWLWGPPGQQPPRSVRMFARHLLTLRDATVVENHFERWVSSFWALPPGPAAKRSVLELLRDFQRDERGELRRAKLRRIARSVRHAFTSATSEYGWKR
jgi:hypothetical protein